MLVGAIFKFLVLYVDDILLATNDTNMLAEIKQMLYNHFDMRDLGEASFILGIKIVRDRTNYVLQLSQRAYIDRILKRFDMHNCSLRSVPVINGERLSKDHYPRNDRERIAMKNVRYSSAMGSLMYDQVCTRPNIAFVVGVLGRFMGNPSLIHYQIVKKVFKYLQGTKDHMLTYQRTNSLDVVGYSDADFKDCVDDKKSTIVYYIYMSWKEELCRGGVPSNR